MVRKTVKEYVLKIHNMSSEVEEALALLHNAFIYNKDSFIRNAEGYIEKIRKKEKELTTKLIEESATDETARLYSTVPVHIERMASNLEHIARSIDAKIKENLLFSDKAMIEINYLFTRVKEIISNVSDLILARNIFLANYIKESEKDIERTASEYATLHEERLIEGLCLPKASGVYVVLLDSIKRIAWNAKEIAQKLSK
jgi:Na+/phosphate symporter